MPCVSVIIPVFNSAPLISGALRSVFTQTFRDFEVIVVDDGSEDENELAAALAPWSRRFECIRQPNGGPARARNTGIARATGHLIAFLDADDEWMPEKLARQVQYFDRHPETGLLHTGVIGNPHVGKAVNGPPQPAFCELFHTDFFINTLTVMVPRRVLEEIGGFDERREVHIEDWDLWLRIASRYPLGFISEPLAYHRPGGIMSSQVERTYRAQELVMDKHWALCARACATHRAAPEQCERARRHVLYRDWGCDRLLADDRLGARDRLRRAIGCRPSDLRTASLYLSTFVSNEWRARTRRFKTAPWRRPQTRRLQAAGGPAHAAAVPSLVHDTTYRRLRRRMIGYIHDCDDAVARMSRGPKRILFDATSPMNFAVFRPVYERLRRDARLDLWFTAHGEVWQADEIFSPAGITTNIVSPSTAARMKVDAYVNADFWDMTWLHRRTRRIHFFHGVAGKYGLDAPTDLAPMIAAFDCLMFANDDRRRRYIEAGLVPDDDVKAALVGYPKTDRLVDGSLDRAAIASTLGLDPSLPVVTYAPTWSPYSSLNAMGDEIIDGLAAAGMQVIVKLHDRSYDLRARGSGGVDWAARLAKYHSHPRVRIVREADGSHVLMVADVLVSDHSSIAFEYMLLDRPIVVIDCPELIARAGISRDKVAKLRSASHVVTAASDVPSAVAGALREPGRLSAERRRTAEELFFRPGTATDRAVALIYRLLDLQAFCDVSEQVEPRHALLEVG